jgi:hypothetical protein
VWFAVGGLAVLCLVLLVVTVRDRRSGARERHAARAEVADLRARLEELERDRRAPAAPTAAEFVITGLGGEQAETEPAPAPAAPIDGTAFADTVLRETVVKAASLAHGVRRGLAPATRNRIRFEMKQEVRRARRQRRADLRRAQRDLHARQRAMLAEEAEAQ